MVINQVEGSSDPKAVNGDNPNGGARNDGGDSW